MMDKKQLEQVLAEVRKGERGMTLIEIMVVIVIIGLVSAVGTALVYGLGGYFVIQGTLKKQDFIYFEETFSCYATFYFIEKS